MQAALAAVSCIAANYIDIVGVTGSIPVSPTTGHYPPLPATVLRLGSILSVDDGLLRAWHRFGSVLARLRQGLEGKIPR